MRLSSAIDLGTATARNRLVFGPHVTNLGRDRGFTDRHVSYYERRAAGGAGVVVTETASVHSGDWPYERAPLAKRAGPGWARIAAALHVHGTRAVASLGHAGAQGSSAYSQAVLWGASPVPQNNDREVPKEMESADLDALVAGFADAARVAVTAGMDGVEINAGQFSLLRQFLSGLTNLRADTFGADRGLLLSDVLAAVRSSIGSAVVGLRLSCDEMAPWAGITPEAGVELAARFAQAVDYLVVERGSIYTVWATRPDGHIDAGFNLDLTRRVRDAVAGRTMVVVQGSIVDVGMAEGALADGACDAVEMTRAQIADPDLGSKVTAGDLDGIRPCVLCNQRCMVRDARNPIVTCIVEPSAGHEFDDPDLSGTAAVPQDILVVGAGPAGLETARIAAARGHRVTVRDRSERVGGAVVVGAALPGLARLAGFVDWQRRRCEAAGVAFELGREVTAADLDGVSGQVVICTGGRVAPHGLNVAGGAVVLDGRAVLTSLAGGGGTLPDGSAAIWDPLGGSLGVGLAEVLSASRPVTLISPDLIVAKDLALTGDLAPANIRLHAAGVRLLTTSEIALVEPGRVHVEDRYTAAETIVEADWVVAAVHREPELRLWSETGKRFLRVGDAVAPRSVHEAVLEGRRAVAGIEERA